MIKMAWHEGLLNPTDIRRKYTVEEVIVNDYFLPLMFPNVPQGREDIHQISILGLPSSGKTSLIEFLIEYAYESYGMDIVNFVYANGYRVAQAHMDWRPVQLIVLDDVSGQASSRQSGKNTKSIQIGNTLRHALKRLQKAEGCPYNGGIVILILSWQRDNDLDRAFKQADFQIHKTAPVLADEREYLAADIGEQYVQRLEEITHRIRVLKDQSAKSECVARMTALSADNGGVGIFRYERAKFRVPDILDEEEYLRLLEAQEKAEEEYRKQQKEQSNAPVQARARVPDDVIIALAKDGKTVREIAGMLPISKSTVQRRLKDLGYLDDGAIV